MQGVHRSFLSALVLAVTWTAAAAGPLRISIESKSVDPVRIENQTNVFLYPEAEAVSGVRPKVVLRYQRACDWKSVSLESSKVIAEGAWTPIERTNLAYTVNGNAVEVVDLRPLDPLTMYYRLKAEVLPDVYRLGSVPNPDTPFTSDISLDDQFAYFGNSHGELFRVAKNGSGPIQRIAALNFSRVARVLVKQSQLPAPSPFYEANNLTTLGNDMAIFGVSVDGENIYFTANKVVTVSVPLDQVIPGVPEPVLLHVMVPHTGSLFYLPKVVADAAALAGHWVEPILLATGLHSAAGIVQDETHVYWSCLGSPAEPVDLATKGAALAARMIAAGPGVLDAIGTDPLVTEANTALFVALIYGMPPFIKNGSIQRMLKPAAAPELVAAWADGSADPAELMPLVQPQILAAGLSLPSRQIVLQGDRIYFGETGNKTSALGPSLGPANGSSGVRRIAKAGGPVASVTSAENAIPAFLIAADAQQIYFGGNVPCVGGVQSSVRGLSLFGGVYRVPVGGGDLVMMGPGLDIETPRGPRFSATSSLALQGEDLYFNNTFLLGGTAATLPSREGSVRAAHVQDVYSVNPLKMPTVLRDPVQAPSTLAVDDCAVFVTSTVRGTNSIMRLRR